MLPAVQIVIRKKSRQHFYIYITDLVVAIKFVHAIHDNRANDFVRWIFILINFNYKFIFYHKLVAILESNANTFSIQLSNYVDRFFVYISISAVFRVSFSFLFRKTLYLKRTKLRIQTPIEYPIIKPFRKVLVDVMIFGFVFIFFFFEQTFHRNYRTDHPLSIDDFGYSSAL